MVRCRFRNRSLVALLPLTTSIQIVCGGLLTSALPLTAAAIPELDKAMKSAKIALKKGEHRKALDACNEAFDQTEEPEEGGPLSVRAMRLCGKIELDRKRWKKALRYFEKASHLTVQSRSLRKKTLADRKNAAKRAKMKSAIDRIDRLKEQDKTLRSALRRPRCGKKKLQKTLAALEEAASRYGEDGDTFRERWVQAARGIVLLESGQPEEGRPLVMSFVKENTPKPLRISVFRSLWRSFKKQKATDDETRYALMYNGLRYEHLPESKRRYTRMRGLDALCLRYDEAHGVGACARLENEVTGRYTITDFSLARRKQELSQEDIEKVHRQGLPALQQCVLQAARRDSAAYRNTDLRIAWTIRRDGKVSDIEIEPERYRRDLEPCTKERLGWLRYPRVSSKEMKNVVIPYRLD